MTFIQHHDHPTAAHKLPRCVFFSGPTKAPEVVRIPGDRALLPPQQPNDFAPTVRSPPHVADFLVAPGGEPQTAKMRIAQFFLHAIGVFLNLFFVCRNFYWHSNSSQIWESRASSTLQNKLPTSQSLWTSCRIAAPRKSAWIIDPSVWNSLLNKSRNFSWYPF